MDKILEQFGLDQTYFFHFGLFVFTFLVLSQIYFKPFLKLFEARYKRTVQDREAADKMMEQAESKLEEYERRVFEARLEARKSYESFVTEARKEESELLNKARAEVRKMSQDATAAVEQQRERVKADLEKDVDAFAVAISERLLSRKS